MPRFVVLRHATPPGATRPSHWDLMLEVGGALRTWALEQAPGAAGPIAAEALPDHRLAYLDYEGEISGGRGAVVRIDAGEYCVTDESPERLAVVFAGQRLRGPAVLERIAENENAQRWKVCFSTTTAACWNDGGVASSESSVRPAR